MEFKLEQHIIFSEAKFLCIYFKTHSIFQRISFCSKCWRKKLGNQLRLLWRGRSVRWGSSVNFLLFTFENSNIEKIQGLYLKYTENLRNSVNLLHCLFHL